MTSEKTARMLGILNALKELSDSTECVGQFNDTQELIEDIDLFVLRTSEQVAITIAANSHTDYEMLNGSIR